MASSSSLSAPRFKERPGSTDGTYYPTSAQCGRLIDGIDQDDEELKSKHYNLTSFDYQLEHLGSYIQGDEYFNKHRKIVTKEKLLFRAMVRAALKKIRSDGIFRNENIGLNVENPEVMAYSRLKKISTEPQVREIYRDRLSKLVVLKMVNFHKENCEDELLSVIRQIKAMNRFYSCNIPLILASNYYNNDVVEHTAKQYSDKYLSIDVLKQPLFPLFDIVKPIPKKPRKPSDGEPSHLETEEIHLYITQGRMPTKKENIHMLPHEVISEDWYVPGSAYILCEQVSGHPNAKDKEFILLLDSPGLEDVVDLQILNYLFDRHLGGRVEICFEAIKPSSRDLDKLSYRLVKIGDKLTVLDKNSEYIGLDVATDGLFVTNNMWINVPFLRSDHSDIILKSLISAREVTAENTKAIKLEMTSLAFSELPHAKCVAVEVPAERLNANGPMGWLYNLTNPSLKSKYKLRIVGTYFISYIFYHMLIYVITASLHQKYLGNDGSGEENNSDRKKQELTLFWVENIIWLALVFIYMVFLTYRRVKMAGKTRSKQERESRALADCYQAILLATTRFLYADLNKTSEVQDWFGSDPWVYLFPLHIMAFVLEIVGSLLIMFLIDPPNVMEPVETT